MQKEQSILSILLYCHNCKANKSTKYFIGDCSHLLCENCITDFEVCKICKDASSFVFVDKEKRKRLVSNPSLFFMEPINNSVFQMNSAINLIYHYKEQIQIYKNLLRKAKEELELCKKSKVYKKEKEISVTNINLN